MNCLLLDLVLPSFFISLDLGLPFSFGRFRFSLGLFLLSLGFLFGLLALPLLFDLPFLFLELFTLFLELTLKLF